MRVTYRPGAAALVSKYAYWSDEWEMVVAWPYAAPRRARRTWSA